jgi:pyruvate dehydrogenase E1 component beta subunit
MVATALAAADALAADGIEAEVIDLRGLAPFDLPAVVASVRRTGRLVVASEAVVTGGLGAEVAASVAGVVGADLRAPIERVGAPFVPVPAGSDLETLYLPNADDLAAAVRRTLAPLPGTRDPEGTHAA